MSNSNDAEAHRGQLAFSLLTTWQIEHREDALVRKLDEVAADGGTNAIAQAAIGLTEVAGMFLELYAESAGVPIDTAFREATVAFRDPDTEIPDA
jgi:hypothetical protein